MLSYLKPVLFRYIIFLLVISFAQLWSLYCTTCALNELHALCHVDWLRSSCCWQTWRLPIRSTAHTQNWPSCAGTHHRRARWQMTCRSSVTRWALTLTSKHLGDFMWVFQTFFDFTSTTNTGKLTSDSELIHLSLQCFIQYKGFQKASRNKQENYNIAASSDHGPKPSGPPPSRWLQGNCAWKLCRKYAVKSK